MSGHHEIKIQKLIQRWPAGTVATMGFFAPTGANISRQLLRRYTKSNWITPLGSGAYIKAGDQVSWQGGLYALQTHSGLRVHVGALTALSLQGLAHYVRLGQEVVFLFSPPKTNLPLWFKNQDWTQHIRHSKTSFLPPDTALVDFQASMSFSIRISAPERAILECLYLSPAVMDLMECYQIMEGLTTLRPRLLQLLLEQCGSVKVKRLFLFMADKAGHEWSKRLDFSKLDLGTGARSIVTGGLYQSKYDIIIPEELAK